MVNKKTDYESQNEDESTHDDMDLVGHPAYEKLQQDVKNAQEKAQENAERVARMQAEYANALQRLKRDIDGAHKYGLEKFALELLPIVDSLELCISNVSAQGENSTALLEGVNLTLKMFLAAFEKFGIKQIYPVGQPFDPAFQQAISTQPDRSVPPGSVVSVLQKGYTLHDRLIRPALVVVSKAEN